VGSLGLPLAFSVFGFLSYPGALPELDIKITAMFLFYMGE
jgi:hypothetical protein